jgi:hypothetical protein
VRRQSGGGGEFGDRPQLGGTGEGGQDRAAGRVLRGQHVPHRVAPLREPPGGERRRLAVQVGDELGGLVDQQPPGRGLQQRGHPGQPAHDRGHGGRVALGEPEAGPRLGDVVQQQRDRGHPAQHVGIGAGVRGGHGERAERDHPLARHVERRPRRAQHAQLTAVVEERDDLVARRPARDPVEHQHGRPPVQCGARRPQVRPGAPDRRHSVDVAQRRRDGHREAGLAGAREPGQRDQALRPRGQQRAQLGLLGVPAQHEPERCR